LKAMPNKREKGGKGKEKKGDGSTPTRYFLRKVKGRKKKGKGERNTNGGEKNSPRRTVASPGQPTNA